MQEIEIGEQRGGEERREKALSRTIIILNPYFSSSLLSRESGKLSLNVNTHALLRLKNVFFFVVT